MAIVELAFDEMVDLVDPIPCDYADEPGCKGEAPAWVLFFSCCEEGSGCRLACDKCKDARLLDHISVECHACGYVFEHAPEAYSRIEPLERK